MFQKKISSDYIKSYCDKRYLELDDDRKEVKKVLEVNNLRLKDKTILNLAAGPGTFEIIFSEFFPKNITYLDFNIDYLNFAKNKHKNLIENPNSIMYINDDLMGVLNLNDNSYDFIFCNISLFYVSNEKLFFENISRILKKGGNFYFVTPSFNYIKKKDFKTKSISIFIYFLNLIFKKKFFPTPIQSYSLLKKVWSKNFFEEIYFKESLDGLMSIVLKNNK